MAGKFLSLEEAARLLGVSTDEVNRLVDRKKLFPMRDGATVKFKSDDVERLADHVVVMAAGRNVVQGTIEALVGGHDSVSFRGPMHLPMEEFRMGLPPECTVAEGPPGHYRVDGSLDPTVLAAVAAWCGRHGVPTSDVTIGRRSLDDVVTSLVGDL